MQPILALSCLQKLHLWQRWGTSTATAAELAQLSSLSSFTDLTLSCIDASGLGIGPADVTVWECLPLRSLSLGGVALTHAFLQQLSALQGLTSLSLDGLKVNNLVSIFAGRVSTAQVAAAVQQLTALRHLRLTNTKSWCEPLGQLPISVCGALGGSMSTPAVRGVVALLRAVGKLQELSDVHVCWHFDPFPLNYNAVEAQQVSGVLDQLLPPSLVPCCRVDAGMLTIFH
jgi:hypothetical protein